MQPTSLRGTHPQTSKLQYARVALKTMKTFPPCAPSGCGAARVERHATQQPALSSVKFKQALRPRSPPITAGKVLLLAGMAPKTCALAPPQGCVACIATSQVWVGVLLPLLLSMRRESAAAARFAQENGVPPTDCRRRAYTWLHRATTVGTPASGALAAGLIGVYAVCAAAAWAYLGRVYG